MNRLWDQNKMSQINDVLETIVLPLGMLWGKADNTRAHEYTENNYRVFLRKEFRIFAFDIPLSSNANQITNLANKAVADFTVILTNDL